MTSHTERLAQYALDITDGKIKACKAVILACQRFIDDLDKSADDTYKWEFRPSLAENVCNFIELLPHTKGQWAGRRETIKLEPWQSFVLGNIFGWVDKETGTRRYRKAYIQVARKNGKSIFAAGIGLYMLTEDGEHGAEVYCGATNKRQAMEVYTPARIMCEKTPELCEHYDVKALKSQIIRQSDNGFFEPVIGQPKDGGSPHAAIVDEYHQHSDNSMVDCFITGMGARSMGGSPLLLIITTAGFNIDGPCYDEYALCKKVLEGSEEDDRLFAIIYEIEQSQRDGELSDNWEDPENLIKANPNLGVSVSREFLEDQLNDARRDPKKQNAFLTKHLNKWVAAGEAWLSFAAWEACGTDPDPDKYIGWDCMHGIDLASKCDIAAYVKVFFKLVDDKMLYRVFPKFFIPKAACMSEKSGKYESWDISGHVITSEGEEIDFEFIKQHILADCRKYGAIEIPYDPWNATYLAQNLADEDLPVLEFQQTAKNMSAAMYEIEAAVKSKRLRHDGNPVMNWMLSNVQIRRDLGDNLYPRKARSSEKIDGIVGAIMGVARAMAYRDENLDFSEGLLVV
jgi:phage terminase large subunit-like protein